MRGQGCLPSANHSRAFSAGDLQKSHQQHISLQSRGTPMSIIHIFAICGSMSTRVIPNTVKRSFWPWFIKHSATPVLPRFTLISHRHFVSHYHSWTSNPQKYMNQTWRIMRGSKTVDNTLNSDLFCLNGQFNHQVPGSSEVTICSKCLYLDLRAAWVEPPAREKLTCKTLSTLSQLSSPTIIP